MSKKRVNICGTAIDNVSFAEAVDFVRRSIEEKRRIVIVTPNVDHIIKLRKDAEFRRIYEQASLVLADGMPLLWAAWFLGTPLKEKVSGSDLCPTLCALAAEKKFKVFLLGGRPNVASKAAEILKKTYPEIHIMGHYSPPVGFENDPAENEKILTMIDAARPDILFVGLGAPKQEKWMDRHRSRLQVPVLIGVGVTFEYISGLVWRAPHWMQVSGLEWFWRLLMEPARLWKRYLIEDIQIFWLVWKQKQLQMKTS